MARNMQRTPNDFTFNDIANMYFDACIERYLKQKYKGIASWQFVKNYTSRIQDVGVLIKINFVNGESKEAFVYMPTLMDSKANSKDVLEYCEAKRNDVKAFIRQLLIDFSDDSVTSKTYDVSKYTEDEVGQICDVVTDEGLRVFVQGQNIAVQRM
jgi:hypothetical protein